jgi:hypothetical protein
MPEKPGVTVCNCSKGATVSGQPEKNKRLRSKVRIARIRKSALRTA